MKWSTIIGMVLGTLGLVATVLFFYYPSVFKGYEKQLTLTTYNTQLLTKFDTLDSKVTAKYYFNDSLIVDQIWSLRFAISNSGRRSVVGANDRDDIIGESLSIKLPNEFKVIQVDSIEANFPFRMYFSDNSIELMFGQIKPQEFVQLNAYLVTNRLDHAPGISVYDRGLIDVDLKNIDIETDSRQRLIARVNKKDVLVNFSMLSLYIILAVMSIPNIKHLTNKGWKSSSNSEKLEVAISMFYIFLGILLMLVISISLDAI